MAFGNLSLTDAYTAIITKLNTQLIAVASLFRDQTTGDFTNQLRYSSANSRFEYWNGSAWAELNISAATIAISTNATAHANATTGAEHGATAANTGNAIVRRDVSGNFNAGTITGTVTNASALNNQAASFYATAAQVTQAAPPGAVLPFAIASAPTGWLICDGSAVSRVTYAALFSAIGVVWGAGDGSTTFNLPELRGEFVRGLAAGRAVDAGRALGTAQAGYVEAHTHTTLSGVGGTTTGGGAYPFNIPGGSQASGSYGTGTETRPRNVALLYCIKL